MCDTQVLKASNGIWFAKNSDREPHEPQAVVRIPAVRADPADHVRTTYLTIPQNPDRHAVLLCKPCWIWGAEMGVNEHGLAIGNEAVFTRRRSLQPALLGMDLLRLALERASTAPQAIDVIAKLLQAHGQGGPAGHADKNFHYDSSFILADPHSAWVMETAGREWVAREVDTFDAISNGLSTANNYTRSHPGTQGSFERHDTRLLPFFAASRHRRNLSRQCLAGISKKPSPGFAELAQNLRTHTHSEDPLRGSNRDICMHATGPIRRSQTTGSLIAHLGPDGPRLLTTGTSAPCLSPFRPLGFAGEFSVLSPRMDQAAAWDQWQPVHKTALFDSGYRRELRAQIHAWEQLLFPAWQSAEPPVAKLEAELARITNDILSWPRAALPRRLSFARRIWT